MPPTPTIPQPLRTAADWPLWIQQVNARLLALDLREYLSIGVDGELELSPPKPVEAPDGGTPKNRVTGKHTALQLSQKTKYLTYIRSRNDYVGFMTSVRRSIDPEIGFDISEDHSFGTLVQELKAHLGLDGSLAVVPRAEAADGWSSFIRQDLRGVAARGWGEKLVKAYRSRRKLGIDDFDGWRPHVEFVAHVNRFYPHLAGTIYLYLERIQEEQGDHPRKRSFAQLVRFGVKMVARLGQVPWGSPQAHVPENPGRKALEYPREMQEPGMVNGVQRNRDKEEPRRPDPSNAPNRKRKEHPQDDDGMINGVQDDRDAPKRRRKEHPQDDEPSGPAKRKSKKAPVKKKTPAKKKAPVKRKTKPGAAREKAPAKDKVTKVRNEESSFPAEPPDSPSLFVTCSDDRCHACRRLGHATESCVLLERYRVHGESSTHMTAAAKSRCREWLGKEGPSRIGIEAGQSTNICYICEEANHVTDECNFLGIHRKHGGGSRTLIPQVHRDRCIAWQGRRSPAGVVEVARSPEKNCGVCRRREHVTETCRILDLYRMHGEATRGLNEPTKERCRTWLKDNDHTVGMNGTTPVARCEACDQEGHLSVDYESLRMNLPPRADLRVPGFPNGNPPARNPEFSATEKAVECELCGSRAHKTGTCTLMKLHMGHCESASIPPEPKERFQAQMEAEERAGWADVPVCEVCRGPGHATYSCSDWLTFLKDRNRANIPGAARKRCFEWLRKKRRSDMGAGRRVELPQAPHAPQVRCVICGNGGHVEAYCYSLKAYRKYGDKTSNMKEYVKTRCRE